MLSSICNVFFEQTNIEDGTTALHLGYDVVVPHYMFISGQKTKSAWQDLILNF